MTSLMRGTGANEVQPATGNAPISDLDPYSDGVLLDPWPAYAELQDAGPAVWLSKYEMFALTRYDSVWKALQDPASFPSSLGVMMNDHMNQVLRGNTLCSDGEDHTRLRHIIMKPLTASALKALQERVNVEADELVQRLVSKGSFCACESSKPDVLHSRSGFWPLKLLIARSRRMRDVLCERKD